MKSRVVNKSSRVIRKFVRDVQEDSIGAYSAQAAFFVIISAFPLAMLLLTLLKYLPYFREGVPMIQFDMFPRDLNLFATEVLQEIVDKSSNTVLSISAVVALWTASKGVYSIILGLTSAYSIKETRGYFFMRFLAVFYTLVFLVMLIAALGFLVFGNVIYHASAQYLPLAAEHLRIITAGIRWLLGFGVLVLLFVILYIAVPDRKSTFFEELPGALVSAVGWVGFSYLYSFYIDHFGNYANLYGSLTAIVLLMLWLYFCMYIVLFGAEVNVAWNSTYRRIAARFVKDTKKRIKDEIPKIKEEIKEEIPKIGKGKHS